MGSVLLQLFPLIVGSVLMPTWILLVLILLGRNVGLVGAAAFVSGITAVRLIQGVVFGVIIGASDTVHRHGAPGTIVATLLLVAGLLMWMAALRQAFREDDADSPVPKLLTMVGALRPLGTFGLGALLVMTSSRAWIFTLAALGVIGQARLDYPRSVAAFLIYVFGAELLLIAPILVSVYSPVRLDVVSDRLERHNRPIVVVVSLVVGGFFLWRGIAGLTS